MQTDFELLKYLNVFKNLCYSHLRLTLDVNNKDFCMYQLMLFNDDYDCLNDLNRCIKFCKDCNINSIEDVTNILAGHINSYKSVITTYKTHVDFANLYDTETKISKDNMFVKLDSNKTYLSIDLRHAYSQYADTLNIMSNKFDTAVIDTLPHEYLKELKKIRIFIYHQCLSYIHDNNILNMLLTILKSDHQIINKLNELHLAPISYNIDELVFDVTDYVDVFKQYVGMHKINNYEAKVMLFVPHKVTYLDPESNKECNINIRYNIMTRKNYIANRTCKYMCQIYKAYKNLPLCDYDLYVPNSDNPNVFYKMPEPIKIISVE